MEKKFLLYVLYITLIEIRERSYESKDERIYGLCDLLHNIPLRLDSEKGIKEAYERLLEDVETLGIYDWLNARKQEFYQSYPEYEEGDNA
ncbi:hypothetical protein A4H97_24175 [Niastella yeongjuensis]|uniref:Uncharacterized protein n=1 Tax=Niastella yeongjuensis TaxID=354355 RepID=A0A1V9F390_9BACT|nr:hypothetical protein [Niastella yeongjuensis]OQP52801.1 hypothetical protein A4H97_24175 [Niastella yeongjuensis]SEP20070.1 hypothetical protein SAMN05660816_04723 [Niastella yeongjuensis]